MTTTTNTAPATTSANPARGSNEGLVLAVQTLKVVKKSKPQAPRATITHVSDEDALSKQADALTAYASTFVAITQEWQERYNDSLAYLASYPSTWNIELPSGLRANGKRLAQRFTHGGLIEDNKFIDNL